MIKPNLKVFVSVVTIGGCLLALQFGTWARAGQTTARVVEEKLGPVVAVSRTLKPNYDDCKFYLEEKVKNYYFGCEVKLGQLGKDRFIDTNALIFKTETCHVLVQAYVTRSDYGYSIQVSTPEYGKDKEFPKDVALGCLSQAFMSPQFVNQELKATFYTIQQN